MGSFVKGKMKKDGGTFYGWHGNQNINTKQFLENSVSFKTLESVINEYQLLLGNTNITDAVEISEQKIIFPEGKCFNMKIKINTNYVFKDAEVVEFKLTSKIIRNKEIQVKISDPFHSHFQSDKFSFSGIDIKKNLSITGQIVYNLRMTEKNGSEKDQEANCEDYTDEGKGSYNQCVKTVVDKKFLSVYGCMPPWFTDDIHEVCEQGLSKEEWKNISDLVYPAMHATYKKV